MQPEKLYQRMRQGRVQNVKLRDLVRLLEACGFVADRVSGSHQIFVHPDDVPLVNLQDVKGQAKPYQVRQVLRVLDKYALVPEEWT